MNINKVIESLSKNGYAVKYETVVKNGKKKSALMVGYNNNVMACFYEDNLPGEEKEAITFIMNAVNKADFPDIKLVNDIMNWDKAKERVLLGVRPKTEEDDVTVTERYLDLELYVYIPVYNGGIIKVNKNLLKSFGVTRNELFSKAKENTEKTIVLKSLNVIVGSAGIEVSENVPDNIVVTNKNAVNGASAICFKNLFNDLADMFGVNKIYIIPSSVHELIITTTEHKPINVMNEIISSMNKSELPPESVLSNHVYIYDKRENEIIF